MNQHNDKNRQKQCEAESLQAAAVAEKGAEVDADAVTAELLAEGKRGKDDDEEIDGIKGKQRPVGQKIEKQETDRGEKTEVIIVRGQVIDNAVGKFEVVYQAVSKQQNEDEKQRPVAVEINQNARRSRAGQEKADVKKTLRLFAERRQHEIGSERRAQQQNRQQRIFHQRQNLFQISGVFFPHFAFSSMRRNFNTQAFKFCLRILKSNCRRKNKNGSAAQSRDGRPLSSVRCRQPRRSA